MTNSLEAKHTKCKQSLLVASILRSYPYKFESIHKEFVDNPNFPICLEVEESMDHALGGYVVARRCLDSVFQANTEKHIS